jgi:CHAD domain-containing protein
MAYRLKKGEPIAGGLKRIVRDEIESAASHLRGERNADRDEAIHEARKSIKKVRAILKLTRAELGDIYTQENAKLRDIARRLSGFRDAAAMIETFHDLKRRYAGDIGANQLASVGTALEKKKKQTAGTGDIRSLLAEAESALREIGERATTWPLKTDGFEAIEPGLKETYRRGRKALARARKDQRPENYHELRKRVKDLWYHIRLIKSLWTGVVKGCEKDLKDLETWLGDDHNLVLLRAEIAAAPSSYGRAADIDFVLGLIDRYQKKLRDDAVTAGARLYDEKPREYVRRMKHLCDG